METVMIKANSDYATFVHEPDATPCKPKYAVRVRLLQDELSRQHFMEVRCRRRDNARATVRIAAELRSEPKKIVQMLDGQSIRLPDDPGAKKAFIMELIRATPTNSVLVTQKPGFRNGATGFLLASNRLGSVKSSYVWDFDHASSGVGVISGSLDRYQTQVLEPAANSPILSLGVMLALAAPLPNYVSAKDPGAPLISETAVVHLHAGTSTGKTTTTRLVASVFGSPDNCIDWRATDRGFEEAAYQHNDLVLCIDDTEKADLDDGALAKRVEFVAQRLPAGASKAVAKTARKGAVPKLTWCCFAISSGPLSFAELAMKANRVRQGQLVRTIDLPIPAADEGGVLAFGSFAGPTKARARQKLMQRLDEGMAENHGVLMKAWIILLLDNDIAPRVRELTKKFVNAVADVSDVASRRLASKLGVIYAAGEIAVENGLVPWPKSLPMEVATHAYNTSTASRDPEDAQVTKAIKLIAGATNHDAGDTNHDGYFVYCGVDDRPPNFPSTAIGLKVVHDNGQEEWLLHHNRFKILGVNNAIVARVIKRLLDRKVLLPSKNATKSRQPRVRVDGTLKKIRCWHLDVSRLISLYG
jgi:hypothetical protein